MPVKHVRSSSWSSVWRVSERGWGDRCDDTVDCHPRCNSRRRLDRILFPQYARGVSKRLTTNEVALTHWVWSCSRCSGILSRIRSGFQSVHSVNWWRTRSFKKMSNSANFFGTSSYPKGFSTWGALALYWRRVYSSKLSNLNQTRCERPRYIKSTCAR